MYVADCDGSRVSQELECASPAHDMDQAHHYLSCLMRQPECGEQVCGCPLASNPTAWIAVSQAEVAAGGAMHRRCMHLARTVCPELRNDQSYVFVEVHQSERANDWEAAIAGLTAYEERHGQTPRLLPLHA
ncbi:hypothetical protein DMH01_14700 [Amycolatopsis sp. WAC 04182]|nr:hypothetical protein DMH01_14700 [Amycolatopsis sp. WAC 04182]